MAERRMFAKTIIDSDAFMEMPLSTQALYFHLSMRADDDGFVNNPKKVQRMIGCSDDDLKLLLAKSFLIGFDSGVVVIKHWRMHNYIRKDRYKPSIYETEKTMLSMNENDVYMLGIPPVNQATYQLDPQVRLELGKDSIELGYITTTTIEEEERAENFSTDLSTIMCGQVQTTVDNLNLVKETAAELVEHYWHRALSNRDVEIAFEKLCSYVVTDDTVIGVFDEEKAGLLKSAFELSTRKGAESMNWNYVNAIYDSWSHKGIYNQFQLCRHEMERNRRKELNYV